MKRRDFLKILTQSAAGLSIPSIAAAICPPKNFRIAGTSPSSSNPTCGSGSGPGTAEGDWLYRIGKSGNNPNADGVVWYHDFDTKSEVDMFRKSGTTDNPTDAAVGPDDNNTVLWNTTDGPRGHCLEIIRRAGASEGNTWWRPFSALDAASTGRGEADPGANGTLSRLTRTPRSGSQDTRFWDRGYYGDPRYWTQYPGDFDGHDFYIQYRFKFPSQRPLHPEVGGKICYLTRVDKSLTSQEINTVQRQSFDMYRSGSGGMDQDAPGVSAHGNQPGISGGTIGDGLCRYDNNGGRLANCWQWPLDRWATVLYHVRCGTLINGQLATGNPDTVVEVWAAKPGQTSYTQIWKQLNVPLPMDRRPGINSLLLTAYTNGFQIANGFSHKYCQVIFSKKFIPCPNDPVQRGEVS